MVSCLLKVTGINGQVELYEDKLRICRRGVPGLLTQGNKGDKDIAISAITAIQLKRAGLLTNGYIQFAFSGSQDAKGGVFEAAKDENTVMFNAKQEQDFSKLKSEVEKLARSSRQNPTATTSPATELAKFAELLEKGFITEAEFQQKKKPLLGM